MYAHQTHYTRPLIRFNPNAEPHAVLIGRADGVLVHAGLGGRCRPRGGGEAKASHCFGYKPAQAEGLAPRARFRGGKSPTILCLGKWDRWCDEGAPSKMLVRIYRVRKPSYNPEFGQHNTKRKNSAILTRVCLTCTVNPLDPSNYRTTTLLYD